MSITQPHTITNHYVRPTTTVHNLLRTIEAVAARFGVESPVTVRTVDDTLAAEPTPVAVLREAADAAMTTDDTDTWLSETVKKYQRAETVEQIRQKMGGHRAQITHARAPQLLEALAPQLRKRAASIITTMSKAAAKLPEGSLALDAEAVIAKDVAAERTTVIGALRDLGALAGVHESGTLGAGVPPKLHALLPVLDLPEVEVERITRLHRVTANPNEARDAVRALAKDAEKHGPDIALINVARGEYAGVTLRWAATAEELRATGDRARIAFTQQVVDAP